MNIGVSKSKGPSPAAVLRPEGKLDSSNYTEFIRKAQELYDEGFRNLVIDLQALEYMSSAGLMSLHRVARMFSESREGQEAAANPYRSIDPKADQTIQQHVKLLSPQPQVFNLLEVGGLSQFFHIFTSLEEAIRSFSE